MPCKFAPLVSIQSIGTSFMGRYLDIMVDRCQFLHGQTDTTSVLDQSAGFLNLILSIRLSHYVSHTRGRTTSGISTRWQHHHPTSARSLAERGKFLVWLRLHNSHLVTHSGHQQHFGFRLGSSHQLFRRQFFSESTASNMHVSFAQNIMHYTLNKVYFSKN